MAFSSLRFLDFRNIHDVSLPVRSEQVFFIGPNGQGKTNILEAVYLLCYGTSFRTKKDEHLWKDGNPQSSVWGFFQDAAGFERKVQVRFDQGKKEIRLDDKPVTDRKELVELFPCVVFCHEDLDFVKGGPEYQRQFVNQTASLVHPSYLTTLRVYTKALKTRNHLVKTGSMELIPAYDHHLIASGTELTATRQNILDTFNLTFTPLAGRINADLDGISLVYRPSWKQSDPEVLAGQLKDRLEMDMRMGTTTSGPHRDKVLFVKDGEDFLPRASTGQMRLLSLLLRLCQALLVGQVAGKKPILLLDDVLLELDPDRRLGFLRELPESEQTFFTFLPGADIQEFAKPGALMYEVEAGNYHEKNL